MLRDSQRNPHLTLDSYNIEVSRPAAFTGGTPNTRGDDGGTSDPFTLFTVSGDVIVRIFGVCTVDLVSAGGGTLSVGVTGNTAALIAAETATEIDATGIYLSATQVLGAVALSTLPGPFLVVNSLPIIETIGTADITAGNIYYICMWRPLSPGATVTAANSLTNN